MDCEETPCAEETAFLCAVESPISSSFFIHVSVPHFPNLSFDSLLDCGSSHCFLDEHFARANHFPITPIAPIGLCLLDGSLAGTITSASEISVKFPCGTFLKIHFLLTKLDRDFPAVLGLDWLTLHNPLIDWVRHSVTFRDRINILPVSVSVSKPSVASVRRSRTFCPATPSVVSSSNDTNSESVLESLSEAPSVPVSPFSTPNISLLSAAAFKRAMCSEGAQCFSAFIRNPVHVSGHHVTPASESDLEGVPKFYSHFSDVFSKGSTDSLPPHREYDLKIDVDESAKPPLGPIYPLSQSEVGALQEFIDEHLAMGFIRPSNSPFRAPVLFVKKKDGSLWLCVDF